MTEEEHQHIIDLAILQQEQLDRVEQESMEEEQIEIDQEVFQVAPSNSTSTPINYTEYNRAMDSIGSTKKTGPPPLEKKEDNAKQLFRDKILAIAKATLGDSNACIETNSTNGNSDYKQEMLILKWDYIYMFNRGGHKHTISDIYIALPLTTRAFNDSMFGFRGSVSQAEYISGYSHSHLYANTWNISQFCTGADGINDLWADIKMSNSTDEDYAIKLEGFIHQLEAFLSYESIEGTPYIRFGNISTRRMGQISHGSITSDTNNIIRNLNYNDIDLAMDFNEASVVLLDTEHLHNVMVINVANYQKRLDNGMYVSLGESDISTEGFYVDGSDFRFLGEDHKMHVKPFYTEKKSNETKERKYANGYVVQRIKDVIQQAGQERLDAFCIEKSISVKDEEEGPDNNRKKFDPRDLVLVNTTLIEGVVGSAVLEAEQGSEPGEAGDNIDQGRSSVSE